MRLAAGVLPVTLLVCALPAAGQPERDRVVFQDDFKTGLSPKWKAVGLKPEDFRVRDGGVEMRVRPGKLGADTPMLKVTLPLAATDSFIGSVKVTPLTEFTADGETAGLFFLDDTGWEVAAKKERGGGKTGFAPGKYRFAGRPGEEGDPAKYTVAYDPAAREAGPLRIIVSQGYAFFQVGPSAGGEYKNYFHSAIRREAGDRGFGLAAAGAPPGADHWVRFEQFRVTRD